jgi:hypothetical protein
MTRIRENGARLDAKAVWSVVVVYEDPAARQQAMDFCDQLVNRFWARFEFDVSWWSFGMLQQEPAATEAAARSARADLIVLSWIGQGDFPVPVKGWIESWLNRRGDREGILAGLIQPGADLVSRETQKHNYLRQVARRGAMDYLTQVPPGISRAIPESLDSYTERAAQLSSVLDAILQQPAPPPLLS